ncbi:hypothetical protein DPMN_111853 [Dreissena polymorpha]|uniref:Uncharacterized protein n=1 Tax=Dreissena polymorpha TaxID=45954 RepID=A0A9D4KFF4_DREPO|nr:hypothetical protein DPMN_111853 [Dreissena polymorpha]
MDSCRICKRQFDNNAKAVKLSEKGCHGINEASEKRNDSLRVESGQFVHVECRKTYCNPNYIKRDNRNVQEKLNTSPPFTPLRSKTDKFSYKEHCLYCGQSVIDKGRKRTCDVWSVRTLEPTILNICLQRNDGQIRFGQG